MCFLGFSPHGKRGNIFSMLDHLPKALPIEFLQEGVSKVLLKHCFIIHKQGLLIN